MCKHVVCCSTSSHAITVEQIRIDRVFRLWVFPIFPHYQTPAEKNFQFPIFQAKANLFFFYISFFLAFSSVSVPCHHQLSNGRIRSWNKFHFSALLSGRSTPPRILVYSKCQTSRRENCNKWEQNFPFAPPLRFFHSCYLMIRRARERAQHRRRRVSGWGGRISTKTNYFSLDGIAPNENKWEWAVWKEEEKEENHFHPFLSQPSAFLFFFIRALVFLNENADAQLLSFPQHLSFSQFYVLLVSASIVCSLSFELFRQWMGKECWWWWRCGSGREKREKDPN